MWSGSKAVPASLEIVVRQSAVRGPDCERMVWRGVEEEAAMRARENGQNKREIRGGAASPGTARQVQASRIGRAKSRCVSCHPVRNSLPRPRSSGSNTDNKKNK